MMILQLNPAIPVRSPKGTALAHFLIDYGLEHDLLWVCFQNDTGECWTWKNSEIRACKNITQGREHISPFYNPESVALDCIYTLTRCPDCHTVEKVLLKDIDAWVCKGCSDEES